MAVFMFLIAGVVAVAAICAIAFIVVALINWRS